MALARYVEEDGPAHHEAVKCSVRSRNLPRWFGKLLYGFFKVFFVFIFFLFFPLYFSLFLFHIFSFFALFNVFSDFFIFICLFHWLVRCVGVGKYYMAAGGREVEYVYSSHSLKVKPNGYTSSACFGLKK